uniref:Glucosyltransferase 71E5 n=1 Tax=Carthamus tinctorius TaxID=4222 RepID=A0A1P8C3B1_CARTI|nr:glucosyltransferase 71E5 [Carthamus tinctorius]
MGPHQKTMTNSELVFIPSPGAGHLPPTVELAKLLLRRHHRLSITIIIMKAPFGGGAYDTAKLDSTPRLRCVEIPSDDSTAALISPTAFLTAFIDHHKPHVRNIVRESIADPGGTVRLAGFVVDMFCVDMVDVANEFGAPTYAYFTSGAAMLGLMFHLQAKRDDDNLDVTELDKNSRSVISVPSYINPVPVNVLLDVLFDKNGAKMFLDLAKRFRETKGIIVNSFRELESHAIEVLSDDPDIPPVFPVGPILNLNSTTDDGKVDDIMTWLDEQPERSVVFLCFGSMGTFPEEQIREIASAIESGGHRFLWSLRRPSSKEKMESPKEYEDPGEVLPEGFLERTSGVGRVIGWAPQLMVLSHRSVGSFVSHCGWNSTLESIWCGVPIAAWPMYAEQQTNAFQLVSEAGIAAEVRMDYRTNMKPGGEQMIVTAEEIERGIRRVMSDGEIKRKAEEMKEKSRLAVSEGGSSYDSIGDFIHHVMNE